MNDNQTYLKNHPPRKMVSLFAGIGGFELGFQSINVETTLSCEIDKVAKLILSNHFPHTKIVSDICELDALPSDTDILCAGFPCQDISTIGNKQGLNGERSSLIKEVFRLLKGNKTEWVVIENVPNMLHLHGGETINIIVDNLESLGYNWAYRTINSLAFVPQHRKRVFIVASLNHNAADVLLSDSFNSELGTVTVAELSEAFGFYWTEGKFAIGLYQNGIPTLKCGSTIGIPSPPAIIMPDGSVVCPDIRDAERFQGFPSNWTQSAEQIARPSIRWRLVGNAVTVDVVSWIAQKILCPSHYHVVLDKELKYGSKWPPAAYSRNGKRYISNATQFPKCREEISLSNFLQFQGKPLSEKATNGFLNRLNSGTVKCPTFFKHSIEQYANTFS